MATKEQQRVFINQVGPMCQKDMQETQILASLTMAQCICESGWGQSGLTKVSNNYFGMKGSYNGESVMYPTKEFVDGKYISINAEFKKYPSIEASLKDHSNLFHRLSRYHNLIGCYDYKEACKRVKEDGYATSPTYTETLIKLIEDYDLTRFDSLLSTPEPGTKVRIVLKPGFWNAREKNSISSKVNEIVSGPATFEVTEFEQGWYRTQYGWFGPACIAQVLNSELVVDTFNAKVGPMTMGDKEKLETFVQSLGNIPISFTNN